MIVTGVNAGGKTMLLKSILTAVYLSKYLLPLHANEKTKIGHFKSIEAIIDDPQSVKNDISTFAGRMLEFSKMFHKNGAIVGVDEIELGTDSDEAASLFKVILTKLMEKDITLIVTTHHKRLAALMAGNDAVELVAALYDKKRQLPTYEFLQGSIGKSYAFETAQRYGIPKTVVAEAKEVFGEDKEKLNELIEKSTTLEASLRKKISQADKDAAKLQKLEASLKEKEFALMQKYEAQKMQLQKSYEEAKAILRQAVKGDMKQKHQAINYADKTVEAVAKKQKPQIKSREFNVGDWVQYNNSQGVITKIAKNKAFVEINGMTLQVSKNALKAANKPKESKNVSVKVKKEGGSVKLDLHGKRWEEAREELESFISNALLHGFEEVYVYHGVGSGILARMVKEFCKENPRIQGYEDAPPNLGGVGATIIKF
jgi:DNA mismatch repair protein MutS2